MRNIKNKIVKMKTRLTMLHTVFTVYDCCDYHGITEKVPVEVTLILDSVGIV